MVSIKAPERPIPATSEEQKAMLGKIRRKPVQYDLLTGNLAPKKIKIARGEGHIRLKPVDGEKAVVPGMAHFAGSGPEGKRCYQCRHIGDLPVWGMNRSTPALAGQKDDTPPKRIQHNACRKACEMYEGRVQPGGIEYEMSCKYFEVRR